MKMLKRCFQTLLYLLVFAAAVPAFAQDEAAFFRAVSVDDERAVKRWIDAGGDPNRANPQGQPALSLALRDEAYKVAALLLAQPTIRIDAPNAAGETALMLAALRGQADWVRRLVSQGAAINREGWTPLHYAASGGATDVVRWLLEQGAAIDARSPNRSTPLMMAARYGASESVDWLVARGADTRLRNDRDMTAADFARSAGRDALAQQLGALAAAAPAQR
jgi:uncharacterized protein